MFLLRTLVTACGFLLLGAASAPASTGIEGQFTPDKSTVVSGEPSWLTFRFTNHGIGVIHLSEVAGRGLFFTRQYDITAYNAAGREVSPPPQVPMIIDVMVRDVSVMPGQTYQERLFLPDWFTLRSPGRYMLKCKRGVFPKQQIEFDLPLTVLPPDKKALGLVIQNLGKQTQSDDSAVRDEAALSLSVIPDQRVVPILAALLARPDPPSRLSDADQFLLGDSKFSAIAGLARFPSDASARALLPALQQNDEELRGAAGRALRQMKYADRVLPALKQELRSPSASVRIAALDAVAALQDPRGFGPLVTALHDQVPTVRYAAAKALGTLGDRRAVPVLKYHLKDPDLTLRLACIESLVPLKYPVLTQWLTPIVRSYAYPGHEYPSLEAMLTLRLDCDYRAAEALASCLNFDDPRPSNGYNFFLIYQMDACENGLKYYSQWINGNDTPAGIENNRKVLAAIKQRLSAR